MSRPGDRLPVLKVKKEAEREIRYHYDRGERLALRATPEKAPRRGFFTRLARGRLKSLLPVLLAVLAIVLLVRLLTRDQSTGHLAGYDVALRVYAHEDALLASVTVSWRPRTAERATEAADATVRFSTTATGAGPVSREPLGGGEAVVRGRLPYTGAERRVAAEVSIGGAALRLTAPVGQP